VAAVLTLPTALVLGLLAAGAPPDDGETIAVSPVEPGPSDDDVEADPTTEPRTEPIAEPEEGEILPLPSVDDAPEPTPSPAEPARAETVAPAPQPALPAAPPRRDRLGCDGSKSCRQLTLTGTVLGSLGLAAIGGGVALFVQPDEILADQPAYARSTRPPGLVAITLGSGVVVTSVLMLVAAHRGYKQRDPGATVSRRGPMWRALGVRWQ
jgi:hypothetical protein